MGMPAARVSMKIGIRGGGLSWACGVAGCAGVRGLGRGGGLAAFVLSKRRKPRSAFLRGKGHGDSFAVGRRRSRRGFLQKSVEPRHGAFARSGYSEGRGRAFCSPQHCKDRRPFRVSRTSRVHADSPDGVVCVGVGALAYGSSKRPDNSCPERCAVAVAPDALFSFEGYRSAMTFCPGSARRSSH
jgi:hypothetical protein